MGDALKSLTNLQLMNSRGYRMAIRTAPRGWKGFDPIQRKIDQEWDMAGLARQDGDHEAEKRHTENARRLQRERNG